MLSFLGFDTIVIHNYNRFVVDSKHMFELFYNIGVENFIFAFDFDPRIDSVTIMNYNFKQIKQSLLNSTSYRVKIKCIYNLMISPGAAFNNVIPRICSNKSNNVLFLSLPLFTDVNYDPIALDINHLLYKRKITTVFSSIEKVIETSSLDFCIKFLNNPRIAFTVDINYLFDPSRENFFNRLIDSKSNILPCISGDMFNYAGVLASADNALSKYGKKKYYNLCSQINRSSLTLI